MEADRVFAGAIRKIQSRRSQIDRRRTRLDQERQRLLDKQSELRGRTEKGVAIGASGNLEARRIKSELQDLEKKYTRLNHEEADLRREERDIDLHLGACPAGHTPSSSRETRSTGSATHVRQSVLYSVRRGPRGRKGRPVEEHTGEVSSSELEHTSTDVSQFDALPLNTTSPTLKSADRPTGSKTHVRQSVLYSVRRGPRGRKGRLVDEHTHEVSSSELEHTSTDLSQFDALPLISPPPTLQSADRVEEHSTKARSCEPGGTSADLSKLRAFR
ncbi:uncharacterized protein LOC119337737 [Triticum dicoccoides]|uniref:uncharacterized protein LOC119337737 n=1 Tax=Triticum dicoccoides TaxID=85692 RepID=UPI00189185F0|nr:uncharacterized protein LOC119337737 [Triticum dicoccoides]XP_037465802.1 uncharacterized protein LOC119337737 [Triticum dicoccoides]XP_037465803.1 uncharacterized protein LOC119337737 [Triticum dicoccoides]XP_037465804.1 uncharacterized protein LOC119337737 [Triticum dicoccoides]